MTDKEFKKRHDKVIGMGIIITRRNLKLLKRCMKELNLLNKFDKITNYAFVDKKLAISYWEGKNIETDIIDLSGLKLAAQGKAA